MPAPTPDSCAPGRRPAEAGGAGRRLVGGLLVALALLIGFVGVRAVLAPAGASPTGAHGAIAPRFGERGAPRATAALPGPVVLVGMSGLRWDDVHAGPPGLADPLRDGAVGVLAVRSIRTTACPVDGWLAVSAGRRAGDALARWTSAGCRPVPPFTPGLAVTAWADYLAQAARDDFSAQPGLFAATLRDAGVPAVAVGGGAAIALALPDGRVPQALEPGDTPAALGAAVRRALAGGPRLVVVDAGAIRDPAEVRAPEPAPTTSRAAQRAVLAQRVAVVRSEIAARAPNATVVLASLADSGNTTPRLQYLAATGPGIGGGRYAKALLYTPSTRQPGIAQTTDIAPTLLAALGVEVPSAFAGSAIRDDTATAGSGTPADRLRKVLDLDQAALVVHDAVEIFFNGLVVAQLVLYGVAALVLRSRWAGAPRTRIRWALRHLALAFAAVPVSTYLANTVPWWRASHPVLAVTAAVTCSVVLIALVATLGPWRSALLGPLAVVAATSAAVLAADVGTGSRLQLSSLMGLQPVVAGRFYGFGNVAFAVFATGSLLLTTALADTAVRRGRRRLAVVVVATAGVLTTGVDGQLASDFGGVLAIVPAFAVLGLLVAGVQVTLRRMVAIVVATVLVIGVVSVADWLRPTADQTHLGRFVQTVIDGGAAQVIRRKAEQNLRILVSSWLTIIVPFAALFVSFVLMRPSRWGAPALQRVYDRCPVVRRGLVALIVLLGVGFVANDSGTAIPAVGLMLAIPLLIATSLAALPPNGGSTAPTDPHRAPRPAPRRAATERPASGSPA